MRIVPVIGLLAGCNWVFGLGDTSPVPADVLLPPHVFVTRQVLTDTTQPPQLLPIDGLTSVTVGLLSETETTSPTMGDDGGFDLPFALEGKPYRIAFTMPGDDFEREVIWTGIDQAHYVVPLFGPVDRTTPPGGAILKFDAAQLGYSNPSILTTGLWSRESIGNPTVSTPNPVVDDYDKTIPMGGPLGKLSTTEQVYLVDYLCGTCDSMHLTGLPNHISGYAQSAVNLVGGINVISGTWMTPSPSSALNVNVDTGVIPRIMLDLNTLGTTFVTTISSAVVPSVAMPGSTQLREDGSLAEPVMFALANSPNGALDAAINPFVNAALLPPVLAARWETSRAVNSLQLTSGFTVIQDPSDTDLTPCVDLPSGVTIQDPSTGQSPIDLTQRDLTRDALLTTKTVPLVLSFALADATMKEPKCATKKLVTQDCVVTVFQVGGSSTITKRIIDTVVTGPQVSVAIDASTFDSGMDYSIAISCKSGYEPGAFAKGRFDAIALPFSSSTDYSTEFVVMKM